MSRTYRSKDEQYKKDPGTKRSHARDEVAFKVKSKEWEQELKKLPLDEIDEAMYPLHPRKPSSVYFY